ncbi:molybdopterin synthase catalytic subunit [Candidatus Kryptonium thompsonii]|nr:molybdopterin synthase catalytic subunit [Candidatus Kryptonium thompsoni]
MKYIVDGEIDVKFIMDTLADGSPDSGSLIMFEGRVRADEVGGNFVEKIFYESYISMAEKEIEKIEDEVIKKFGVKRVVIKHRIGEVKVGEVALFVAVLSAHRTEGFEAIQYAINEVKKRVPIWKREILSNGKNKVEGK